jgi:hypothetical protein
MNVRLAALKKFESAPGEEVCRGQIFDAPAHRAHRWVEDGLCCYYSEFDQKMIEDRERVQTRVVTAPSRAVTRRKQDGPSGSDSSSN